jgi:hypothetical protein
LLIIEVPHILVVHAHIIWVLSHVWTELSIVGHRELWSDIGLLVTLRCLYQHIYEVLSHILVEALVEKHLLQLVLLLSKLLVWSSVV